jgi:hypothetical protein
MYFSESSESEKKTVGRFTRNELVEENIRVTAYSTALNGNELVFFKENERLPRLSLPTLAE